MNRERRVPRSAVLWSVGSTAGVGLLVLVSFVVAARGLGPSAYAYFAVLWGAFFGIGGLFAGLQNEVTRAVASGKSEKQTALAPMVGAVSLPVALVGAVVTLHVRVPSAYSASTAIAVGLVGLAGLTLVSGVLAASSRWRALAALLLLDAAVRAATIALVVHGHAEEWLAGAVVSGAFSWVIVLVFPTYRSALTTRVNLSFAPLVSRVIGAMLATGCAALAVGGFPLLIGALRSEELGPRAGSSIAALTLIRSSLLIAVYGMRPMMLRHFLSVGGQRKTVRTAWAWCSAVDLVHVLVVAIAGPTLLRLVLGPAYVHDSWECGAFAVGAAGIMLLVAASLALIAADRHLASGVGWAAALVASAAVIPMVNTATGSVVVAGLIGPWVGVAVLAALMWWPRSTESMEDHYVGNRSAGGYRL